MKKVWLLWRHHGDYEPRSLEGVFTKYNLAHKARGGMESEEGLWSNPDQSGNWDNPPNREFLFVQEVETDTLDGEFPTG